MVAIIKMQMPSTSDLNKHYTITIDQELKIVKCDCIGFAFWGRCKHIKFYKRLIKKLMHETPGVSADK